MIKAGRAGRAAGASQQASQTTRDSFYRGGFVAVQPAKGAHRSGSDALLLAAALPAGATGRLCELGAGAGVAAFAALTANPGLVATLVEIDDGMASLAREALKLPENRHLHGRVEVAVADAAGSADQRRRAGLRDNAFDFVIMNPPYRRPTQRPSPDDLRRLAHHTASSGIEPWLRTAAAILKPSGFVAIIWPSERLAELLAAAGQRFGGLSVTPLYAKPGEPASRLIASGRRGSRAPFAILPAVVLHHADGKPTALADRLINGRARIGE